MKIQGLKSSILIMLAAAVTGVIVPQASAGIIYSICTTGCGGTSGSYATTQAQPGAAGLTFPGSAIAFSAPNLSAGIYTDPTTGATFTAYNGASVDTAATVSGTSFKQGVSGSGSGIEIDLPANTYALALNMTAFGNAFVGIAIGNHNVADLGMFITGGFLTLLSDTPLSNVFLGPLGGGSLQINDFETGTSGGGGGGGGGGDPGDTPEVSTFAMMATGLLVVTVAQRRRHQRTTPRPHHFG